MSQYLPVSLNPSDSLYVKSIGFESNSSLAHWGPGQRNYCILHYVVKGSGYFNGQKVTDNQGFFISSNQLHEYHSDKENPLNYFWIIFSDAMAEKYVLPIVQPNTQNIFDYKHKEKLTRLYNGIFREHTYLSHTQALGFFFKLIELHESVEISSPSISVQHVQKAMLYIENNFNKHITVRDIADYLHLNERYLYNLFIRYKDFSPKEYIERKRYDLACELLSTGSFSITEIAHAVGFPDVCSFSRFFSKRAGISPTKYKNLN